MGKFDNYKFRCSALGKIVSKSGAFTDGNKTYIQEVFIGEIYRRKKEAYGKALEKGLHCEEDGITMLQNTLFKKSLVVKNKERKNNDFIHGECDVIKEGVVYDIKNAYDLFSFGKAELTHDYKWQLVGYAWLWETTNCCLYYCLNNMPEHLLIEEERLLYYKNKWKYLSIEDENYINDCKELRDAHNYDFMPIYEKFKHWRFQLTDEVEQLKKSIVKARMHMNELYEQHISLVEKNKQAMDLLIV